MAEQKIRGAVTRAEMRDMAERLARIERQLEIEMEITRTIVTADPRTGIAILAALADRARDLDKAGESEKAVAMMRVLAEMTA